jgi:hypothetical protein
MIFDLLKILFQDLLFQSIVRDTYTLSFVDMKVSVIISKLQLRERS